MSGKYNGATIKLNEFLGLLIPNILRMGHKTNLCVEHSSEELRMIEGFFTSPQNLYNFLTKSTSRFDIYMEKVEELQEGSSFSVTRWIGCVESIEAVVNSYEVFLCVLEQSNVNGNDRNCQTTASDFLQELKDVNFYISLVFMRNILHKMNIMTLNLPKIEIDAIQAFDTMILTKNLKV